MNIIGTNKQVNLDPNLLKAGYNGIDDTKVAADAKQTEVAPLLFGSSILVSYGFTDVEALVAQLKNENADARVSMKLKALSSIAQGLSGQQLAALDKALQLADSVKSLEKAQNNLNGKIAKSEAEIALMQIKIDSLENQIETARENAKEYNKNIDELKRKKAEIDSKIAAMKAEAKADEVVDTSELEAQAAELENSIKTNEDALAATEKKIAGDTASLDSTKSRKTALEKDVADAKAAIDKGKNEIAGLKAQISASLESIDGNVLKTIAAELEKLAPEKSESVHEIEKQEAKLEKTDIANIIREQLDAIAVDILDEIAEKREVMA